MCPCIKLAVTTALVLQSTTYNIFVIWRWMKKYMWSWCFGRSTRMKSRGKQTERHRSMILTFMALFHQQIVYISRENDRKEKHGITDLVPPLSTSISPWLEIEPCPTKTYSSLDLPSSRERRGTTSVVKMCSSKATVCLYIHQSWLDTPVTQSITDSV